MSRCGILPILALVLALIAGGCGAPSRSGSLPNTERHEASKADRRPRTELMSYAQARQMSVPEVVRSVRRSVVQIIAQSPNATSTGTGFIIDGSSHIVTNNHVVDGASRLTVVLWDNRIETAKLVGADPETDLAVLQISPRNLPTVPLGDSDRLVVGQQVVAIGNALGLPGGPTVTTGVVSAVGRALNEPGQGQQSGPTLYDLIQTDAAINPGNSGGPLLNTQGQVVGINTMAERRSASGVPVQGINFAISINIAKNVVRQLIEHGHITYPFIGVWTEFLYPQTAVTDDLPYHPGQLVVAVIPRTPAERAGLRRGDIITEIDGRKIANESKFAEMLRSHSPGDTITLTVLRDGRTIQRKVALTARPKVQPRFPEPTITPIPGFP